MTHMRPEALSGTLARRPLLVQAALDTVKVRYVEFLVGAAFCPLWPKTVEAPTRCAATDILGDGEGEVMMTLRQLNLHAHIPALISLVTASSGGVQGCDIQTGVCGRKGQCGSSADKHEHGNRFHHDDKTTVLRSIVIVKTPPDREPGRNYPSPHKLLLPHSALKRLSKARSYPAYR